MIFSAEEFEMAFESAEEGDYARFNQFNLTN